MAWRVAKSLELLLKQVNERAPNRSKSSDGSIGDAAHASRTSDHNPNSNGVVTARDFTHDPADGFDCEAFVNALVANRDPRIKYIIWNRRIINSSNWQWKTYAGTNPHTLHAHVSVSAVLSDDTRPWKFDLPGADPSAARLPDRPTLRRGDRGENVERLQLLLGIEADGVFGAKTAAAVASVQKARGLFVDGVVGAYTWEALAG